MVEHYVISVHRSKSMQLHVHLIKPKKKKTTTKMAATKNVSIVSDAFVN